MQSQNYNQPPPNYPPDKHATNTFSQNPSFAQVFSYLIIALEMVSFYLCVHHFLQSWILLGLYTGSVVFVFVSTVITSYKNPTDKVVYQYKWKKHKNQSFSSQLLNCYFCEFCESYCKQTSKHCKVCNRCVDKFDHHCIWINNCIGEENYTVFFVMILSTFANIVIFIVGAGIATAQTNINDENLKRLIPVWFLMVPLGILAVLLLNLILLHIYLMCRGISTFDFLMERRRNEEMEGIEKKNMEKKIQERIKELQAEKTTTKIKVQKKNEDIQPNKSIIFEELSDQSSVSQKRRRKSRMRKSLKFIVGSAEVENPYRMSKNRVE